MPTTFLQLLQVPCYFGLTKGSNSDYCYIVSKVFPFSELCVFVHRCLDSINISAVSALLLGMLSASRFGACRLQIQAPFACLSFGGEAMCSPCSLFGIFTKKDCGRKLKKVSMFLDPPKKP